MILTDDTAQNILSHPADAVLDFVRHNLDSVDDSLPWQNFAMVVKDKAISLPASPEVLTWATAAVLLLDRLGERCSDSRPRAAATKAAMALRAAMINAHGTQNAHPVLDPMILEAWFFRGLAWRYERVAQMLNSETELSWDQVSDLKRLKDGIRILKSVTNQGVFKKSDELDMWYAITGESHSSMQS